MSFIKNDLGLSLIELIVTMTILGILAGGMIPLVRMTAQRSKEVELRRNLRTIRTAIDAFHKRCMQRPANAPPPTVCKDGYPETLDKLVEGVDFGYSPQPLTERFLKRKLFDPFIPLTDTTDNKWGWEVRSLDYVPDQSWNEVNVFDVYSKSGLTAINGTKYEDW
jgi:general secretion pathway protein G